MVIKDKFKTLFLCKNKFIFIILKMVFTEIVLTCLLIVNIVETFAIFVLGGIMSDDYKPPPMTDDVKRMYF